MSPSARSPADVPQDVADAAQRYWAARAEGRTLAVDDVLQTAPGTPDYLATRATTIQLISAQAATLGDQSEAALSERQTLAGSLGLASPAVLAGHGPVPTIEGYDIVGCLGRGGMGAVFEGYQRSTGRRVAIKVMLDRLGGSDAARKRFEREVEVVARLQHPGIVSVLDSGVRKGQYFFVMEYVAGCGLDAALKPGQCDIRHAIDLTARVCDAIDYAHQRGVLHRDLKPSNIIIDADGAPHLLDFGLAKVFDPGQSDGGSHGAMGLTVSGPGQLLGTLAYMAPEQARGQHDQTSVRTDVYALSAIAYELLTGRLPCLMSSNVPECLARIIDLPPPAPSSLRRGLGRDLDAILLKGLEKAPERRYATAGELAADLRRHLAGEPVLARRVSAAGRAYRWIGRNRTISGVTAAAILTLLAVSGVLVNRILRERDLARSNFELVRSILESADPDRFSGVVQLLDGASDRLDRSPPKHEIAEAEIRQLVGSVYTRFGEYPKARANLLRAVAIRENHASGDDPAVADALHGLAASLWWEGKYNEAEPIYSRSLAMRRRLFPRDHASVAFSLTHLAACRLRMGKPDEARELYLEALEMRKRLYGQDHEEVAQALNNVARCDLDAERFEAAQQLFAQSLQMIRRVKGDAHSGTASASQNFGDCLIRRCEAAVLVGDQDRARSFAAEAQEHFQRALDIRNRIYPQGHHLIAMSLASLSRAELALGNPVQARETALRAVKMLEATRRATHPDMAEALDALGLATLAADRSRAPEASALLARALQILSAAPQPSDLMLARIQLSLATSLIAEGRLADARPPLTACVETLRLRRGDGARSPATRHAASMLRDVCTALGDDQAARTWGDLAGHH